MGIKRYFADADNTITNAYKSDLKTRGTGSNMGQADILEVFSVYGQATTTSSELSRVLVQFPVSEVSTDRTNGVIPASGSVSFYLRMFNAEHGRTLPRNFTLEVSSAASGWEEGNGLDMEEYTDLTYDEIGSNWIKRQGSTSWTTAGGDYHGTNYLDTSSSFAQTFTVGTEDLEIDVTTLVEQWINSAGNVLGSKTNYGFGIKLRESLESATKSYYTKKFFARSSEFFFERPVLEARYENRTLDDRGSFYLSSSLATAEDNLNTIYLYNYVRGRLSNIPSIETGKPIYVSVLSGSSDDTSPSGSALQLSVDNKATSGVGSNNQYVVTGGYVSTGIYSASFAFTGSTSLETIYDVWFTGSHSTADATTAITQFHTGAIEPKTLTAQGHNQYTRYVLSMPTLKTEYYHNQTERFRIYAREKDWSPTIYTKAIAVPETTIFESASYEIFRATDDKVVVAYGTGSDNYSLLSYDVSGNYFDLDMSMLDPGYSYGIRYSIYENSVQSYTEQPYIFKFRVSKYDY
jgi:hypothetical protein